MQINIYDLIKWLNENKERIEGSIIKRIYRTFENGIILELYKANLDKKYLYIIPGLCIFLSDKKHNLETDSFIMKLRKDFEGKRIRVNIIDFERIFVVSPLDNDKRIVVELFKPGNIVVLDKENRILYAQVYKDFRIRKIYKKEIYKVPGEEFRIPKNFKEFKEKLKRSNKKDIIRTLAIDFRLGGRYSEYIITSCRIDKNKKPKELTEEEVRRIWKAYQQILDTKKILLDKWYDNINDALERYYLGYIENKALEELLSQRRKIEGIIENQKKQREEIKRKIKEYQMIGNFILNFSWILEGYDIRKIKEEFKKLGIKAEVLEKDTRIIIEVDEKEIENYV